MNTQEIRDLVHTQFNSPRVLDIVLSPAVVGIPVYPARPYPVFECRGCGVKGTLASHVGWVCDCDANCDLVETDQVEWS